MKKLSFIGILSIFLIVFALGVGSIPGPNIKPVVDSVSIDPTEPKTTNDLSCVFMVHDPDVGDVLNATVTWFKNGNSWTQDDEYFSNVEQNVEIRTTSIGDIESEKTTKDDEWKCKVTVVDNGSLSDELESDPVIILNTGPEFLGTIDDLNLVEDTSYTMDLDDYFSDVDGDELSFTYTPDPIDNIDVYIDEVENTATFDPDDGWTGIEEGIMFTASDGEETKESNEFDIIVGPEICEFMTGDLEITDVDFDEDDFKPGEIMTFEVDVDNDGDDDIKTEVEILIYDLDRGKKLVSETSETIKIRDHDDETFDIDVEIPTSKLDEGNEFVLYVKAYEDGDEDEHCNEYPSESIDPEVEEHDVIIEDISFSPSVVSCGEFVRASFTVINIGSNDEDDVYVRMRETTLGIDERTGKFDLDDVSEKDNDKEEDISFTIPKDAEGKDYNMEFIVYYDDGDETWSTWSTLTVECEEEVVEEEEELPENGVGDEFEEIGEGEVAPITTITGFAPTSTIRAWLGDDTLASVLFIIGDIVLVIIAIYFVKLIFTRRRV